MDMAAVLDLNDCALQLWNGNNSALSPGYALLNQKNYQFGEAARAESRLHPRDVNHRFWWQLNTEPLKPAFGPARHTADLVHAHLLELHKQAGAPDDIVLVAPSSMDTAQLSLLLGIIGQCPFEASGLLDRSVAACSIQEVESQLFHIELQLHQAVVTELHVSDGHLQRIAATPIPGCGWVAIQDLLAKTIADTFIRQTRFDPRRQAQTEQSLYDHLPNTLDVLSSQTESNIELGGSQARIEYGTIADACEPLVQRIIKSVGNPTAQVFIDPIGGRLPGLVTALPGAAILDSEAVLKGVNEHRQHLAGDDSGLHFLTRLPASRLRTPVPVEPAAAPEPVAAPEQEPVALSSEITLRLDQGAWTVSDLSGTATTADERPVTHGMALEFGQTLTLADGSTLQLRAAQDDHGTQT